MNILFLVNLYLDIIFILIGYLPVEEMTVSAIRIEIEKGNSSVLSALRICVI